MTPEERARRLTEVGCTHHEEVFVCFLCVASAIREAEADARRSAVADAARWVSGMHAGDPKIEAALSEAASYLRGLAPSPGPEDSGGVVPYGAGAGCKPVASDGPGGSTPPAPTSVDTTGTRANPLCAECNHPASKHDTGHRDCWAMVGDTYCPCQRSREEVMVSGVLAAPEPPREEPPPSNAGCDHCCGNKSDHERGCAAAPPREEERAAGLTASTTHMPDRLRPPSTIHWGGFNFGGGLLSGACSRCGAFWNYTNADERTVIEREHPKHCPGPETTGRFECSHLASEHPRGVDCSKAQWVPDRCDHLLLPGNGTCIRCGLTTEDR